MKKVLSPAPLHSKTFEKGIDFVGTGVLDGPITVLDLKFFGATFLERKVAIFLFFFLK